jgi:sulfate adenylyltransferase
MGQVIFYSGITYCSMETEIRDQLKNEEENPFRHFTSGTSEVLKECNLPLYKQGFCIWFTGLSGAGKSTVANILVTNLQEHGRQVTLLDGDNVRMHLSKGLGFSKEDRDTNIRRISFVALEIVKHGGAVVCATISPYRAVRNECRSMFPISSFMEIFMDTPLEVCEARDTKGLYSLARSGKLENFTGINDPYEAPESPEIKISFPDNSPEQSADLIIGYLIKMGFLADE